MENISASNYLYWQVHSHVTQSGRAWRLFSCFAQTILYREFIARRRRVTPLDLFFSTLLLTEDSSLWSGWKVLSVVVHSSVLSVTSPQWHFAQVLTVLQNKNDAYTCILMGKIVFMGFWTPYFIIIFWVRAWACPHVYLGLGRQQVNTSKWQAVCQMVYQRFPCLQDPWYISLQS